MMRRRTPLALLSLLVVAGLAACGSQAVETARWSAPVSVSPKPPAPRPAPTSSAEVRTRVKAAMLDLDAGFHPETVEFTEENTDAYKLISLCRSALPSDRLRSGQRERIWKGQSIWIRQYVVGYLKVPGRKLADELRATLATCTSYKVPGDGRTSTVLRPSPAPVPNAPDVITFCERIKGDSTVHQCTLILVRGNVVVEIDASGADSELAAGEALIAKLAPLAVAALEKAT
jgi:hypothetical protein